MSEESVRRLFLVASVVVLGIIAIATIVPIGLRPTSAAGTAVEHFAAFAVAGAAVALALPRRPFLAVAILLIVAIALELSQMFQPSRHARWMDLGMKLLGGVVGVAVTAALRRVWMKW